MNSRGTILLTSKKVISTVFICDFVMLGFLGLGDDDVFHCMPLCYVLVDTENTTFHLE